MKSRCAIRVLFLLLLGLAPACAAREKEEAPGKPGPAPRFDAWRVIGPGGGGGQFCPTISPLDSKVILEHCDMTGSYLTTDGGLSWRMINFGTGVEAFAFDARNPKVMYAASQVLFRSDDGGKTWRMALPDPTKTTVHLVGDHAEPYYTTDDDRLPKGGLSIQALAADPTQEGGLYAGLSLWSEKVSGSFLYLTKDRGKTWAKVGEFGRERILTLRPGSPRVPATYVVTNQGVYRKSGDQWTRAETPNRERIFSAAVGTSATTGRTTIYAATDFRTEGQTLAGGVFASEDGGKTWRVSKYDFRNAPDAPDEERQPDLMGLACCAEHPETAYIGVRGVEVTQPDGSVAAGVGVAKSSDGGRHWKLVQFESKTASPNLEQSWFEPRAPTGGHDLFFAPLLGIGVAPTDPEVCVVTDYFRTYSTRDGGKTWQQLYSVRTGDNAWTTRGLDVTTNYGVQFDPFDQTHVYIDYTDIGLFRSEDGGESWISSVEGVPYEWRNTTYWLQFDPEVKGLVWGAFSGTHDLPRPKMWAGTDPREYEGGVCVSTDGGRNWKVAGKGIPQTAVTHVLLEPTSPAGKRTLYACGFGTGVWKSTDNGETWTLKNNGLKGTQPFAWRITRAEDGTLYLILARRSEGEGYGDEGDGALYKSVDQAETWQRVPLPEGLNGPNGLAVDPRDPKRLYLAAWGRATFPRDLDGGVFLSTDGGATWKNVFSASTHAYDVTLDPKQPDTLYVCGFDSAAYRSTDAGKKWSRIRGYNFKWGHRVIIDPVHPDQIYVTTFGGSVWHGPAAGDPKAAEDVVTPVPSM